MRNASKRLLCLSLAVLMTAVTVSGCAAPEAAPPTLSAPTSGTETVIPEPTVSLDKEAPMIPASKPMEGGANSVAQLRLFGVRPGWMNAFETEQGMFLLADSVDSLLDGLTRCGIDASGLDLSAFDGAFFEDYRLAVIPRSTNSGSVRFSVHIDQTADGVKITPVGTMPGVGTADMADWLVLVRLSRADYPGSVTVENVGSAPQRDVISQY